MFVNVTLKEAVIDGDKIKVIVKVNDKEFKFLRINASTGNEIADEI